MRVLLYQYDCVYTSLVVFFGKQPTETNGTATGVTENPGRLALISEKSASASIGGRFTADLRRDEDGVPLPLGVLFPEFRELAISNLHY